MAERQNESKLGFLESLTRLFHGKAEEEPAKESREVAAFDALANNFEAAIRDLDDKAEEWRRERFADSAEGGGTAEEREARRARRIETVHAAMREDIVAEHGKLGTGLAASDLGPLASYVRDVAAQAEHGRDSHELLPRAQFAITERVNREAGELAIARVVASLQREKRDWPDPTHFRPSAQPEEIERSRRRRLAEVRASFLHQDLRRTADTMLGIVEAWGSDYPDRGSPLWEETVLEGVAAGFRARIVKQALDLVSRDREQILVEAEAAVGKQLSAIREVMAKGVTSLEQANRAVASSLRVLDQVLPEIVWKRVRPELTDVSGEGGA